MTSLLNLLRRATKLGRLRRREHQSHGFLGCGSEEGGGMSRVTESQTISSRSELDSSYGTDVGLKGVQRDRK